MKLNQRAVALAAGLASGLWALLCTVFIALWPAPTMNFFGWLIHLDRLAEIAGPRTVTLGNSLSGIAVFFALGYVTGWLFAVLYNKFSPKQ